MLYIDQLIQIVALLRHHYNARYVLLFVVQLNKSSIAHSIY